MHKIKLRLGYLFSRFRQQHFMLDDKEMDY